MELTLAIHPVDTLHFGSETSLKGTSLSVDQEALREYVLTDDRIESLDLFTVAAGEACRFGPVYDIVEPRAKQPGDGVDFPGILDGMALAGKGTTHVLRGCAVTILDPIAGALVNKMVEMSGEAARISPYSKLCHLVVVPHPRPGQPRHVVHNAMRTIVCKAATYLAKTSLDLPPADTEMFESQGPREDNGLPRVVYIGQIHSRQMVADVDEQIFYGTNTTGMVPVVLHPNEWLDGAIVPGSFNMGLETYFYQNHPIISQLYRRHNEGKINFVGTIATMAASDNLDRERNSTIAAELAKWNLGADGAVLSKCGGGAPHADMALTARLCEQMGIRTAVQVNDMSSDRSAESALLFNYEEVDAIVYVGGGNYIHMPAAPVEQAISVNDAGEQALQALKELTAGRICGISSQQGLSRIRSFVH